MNTILIEPVTPKQVDIKYWLMENISPWTGFTSLSGIKGPGWHFHWQDDTYQMWAVDIEDDQKAVEFKLRFL